MTKKIVSSIVLMLFLGAAMPAVAGISDVCEVNLVGQFAVNWPTNAHWPDFNGFAWSVAGTSDGMLRRTCKRKR